MNILFLGGDKRQLEIIKYFDDINKLNNIDLIGYDNLPLIFHAKKINVKEVNISRYDLVIFPVDGVKKDFELTCQFSDTPIFLTPDILVGINKNVKIFTGIMTEHLKLLLGNKKAFPLMEDIEVQKKNSVPTVEGIVADIIYNTDQTINGSNILIFGYGNIGKKLIEVLKFLGAEVILGIKKESEYKTLKKHGIKCFHTERHLTLLRHLRESDIIINTIPSLILNELYLSKIENPNIYILDISSFPYGIDFDSAKSLNLNCKLLPGIPGKTAPITAGKILTKKIAKIVYEKEVDVIWKK